MLLLEHLFRSHETEPFIDDLRSNSSNEHTLKEFEVSEELLVSNLRGFRIGSPLELLPLFEERHDPERALRETIEAIQKNVSAIFEATFLFEQILVRLDILRNNNDGSWDIIEVKQNTEVKEEHIPDLAIQLYVTEGAGIRVKRTILKHLNTECKFPQMGNLFTDEDCTSQARSELVNVADKAMSFIASLDGSTPPAVDIGPHCDDPHECRFKGHCWAEVPRISIFNVPNFRKVWAYYAEGIVDIKDARLVNLTEIQSRVVQVSRSAQRFVDREKIRDGISQWTYPLTFLDFETINPAIPRYIGTSPFQQIPFQFSCHIVDAVGGEPRHVESLHEDNSDPRPSLIEALINLIPMKGNIVSYNAGFESQILKGLARDFPDRATSLLAMAGRLVDPLPVIRRAVYDINFLGSFSIKAVAPALLGDALSYKEMAVGSGTSAQVAFEELISTTILKR